MRTFSIGEFQNQISAKAKAKQEMIQKAFTNLKQGTKDTLVIGYKIVWYGLCSSVTVYMIVKAFTLAL